MNRIRNLVTILSPAASVGFKTNNNEGSKLVEINERKTYEEALVNKERKQENRMNEGKYKHEQNIK